MAPNSKQKTLSQRPAFQTEDDDDDFQDLGGPPPFLTQNPGFINKVSVPPPKSPSSSCSGRRSSQRPRQPLKPSNSDVLPRHPSKRPKASVRAPGKENLASISANPFKVETSHFEPSSPDADTAAEKAAPLKEKCGLSSNIFDHCGLESIESTIDCEYRLLQSGPDTATCGNSAASAEIVVEEGQPSNSPEARLLTSVVDPDPHEYGEDGSFFHDDSTDKFESCTQLDVLLKLCSDANDQDANSTKTYFGHQQQCSSSDSQIHCPLCGSDLSDLTDELRQLHTNDCLDKEEPLNLICPNNEAEPRCPGQVVDGSPVKSHQAISDVSPVLEWLRSLGLNKYEELFVQEEIDWDTLQWLTEEDLFNIGVTALGPRKKIVHALSELRKESTRAEEAQTDSSGVAIDETTRLAANKLITDYFPGMIGLRKKSCSTSSGQHKVDKPKPAVERKRVVVKKNVTNEKRKDIPQWCCIPGTPFRVDAFKYLRRDCSHWFLTHFHMDHYQGLTRTFSHGKIYCSLITARLVNMKLGIPWDNLQILPLNQKLSIAGIYVTCFDANHCPGSIILLIEPPNGKAILHTGDFRFCEDMAKIPVLQMRCVQTLILDTTYCNPKYDFPKQEAVIQFVVEAIQAEAFNPKTLFLIGSYTIGKERLFLEVARVLRKKVYVTAAKLRLLECLELSAEDMQWLTHNEQESHIHVVPMWTLASFKRLKCLSTQYAHRFSLVVAFSPTGWTFGKGKKKSSGRRWQQGTIIRYEVPYSEHCSFPELREFVKFISPENIIPSVNNDGPESASAMVSLLVS